MVILSILELSGINGGQQCICYCDASKDVGIATSLGECANVCSSIKKQMIKCDLIPSALEQVGKAVGVVFATAVIGTSLVTCIFCCAMADIISRIGK
jgi:hypothetical protein